MPTLEINNLDCLIANKVSHDLQKKRRFPVYIPDNPRNYRYEQEWKLVQSYCGD